MKNYLYGIDFGTTNSAISIYDEGRKEIVKTITTPSILYFPFEQDADEEIKCFAGKDAINEYLNDGMKGRFMKSIKRILPRSSFTETKIGGDSYDASDLVTFILKDLKAKADEFIGHDCQKAIIGRPVHFDDNNTAKDNLAQQRLKKACENAGINEVAFQFEPIGAAFAYERMISTKQKVLVADLGGGTTDFTFIELDPGKVGSKNRKNDIIATGGIYIGGDSFDSAFMWDKGTPYFGKGLMYESMPGKMLNLPLSFFTNICSWEKMNFYNSRKIKNDLNQYYFLCKGNPKLKNLITLTDHNLGYSIFQAIEKTKIDLSNKNNSTFSYSKMGIDILETITIEDYDEIIQKDLNKISSYLDDFLRSNNIRAEEIDSLFLTGGTSLVQGIQNLFRTRFPHISVNSGDNFISVAKGLAYSGYLFN